MMKNMFDANALSLTFGGSVATMDQFTQALFMFCVGLDHHSDDAGKDHLISGLNTTGSLIPITFSANGSDGAWLSALESACNHYRPTVYANMTSTLMMCASYNLFRCAYCPLNLMHSLLYFSAAPLAVAKLPKKMHLLLFTNFLLISGMVELCFVQFRLVTYML